MDKFVEYVVRVIRVGGRVYAKKWVFFGLFAVVFLGSVVVLGRLDLLPSNAAKVEASASVVANADVPTPTVPELPTKIEIKAIGLSATIANPITTDTAVLDQELLKGAVRYPTSARLGEKGNIVLFGHSSYLPIVNNRAYKTFNGIQKLSVGNIITVSSSDVAYTYRVKSVAKESANDAMIPLSTASRMLTLSTCDSFTVKTDRFVVVADFVESHAISG